MLIPMALNPDKLKAMSDEELVFLALSGEPNSYTHLIGSTAATLRAAFRMAEAIQQQAQAANAALGSAKEQSAASAQCLGCPRDCRREQSACKVHKELAISTWAVALITLITQGVILVKAFTK